METRKLCFLELCAEANPSQVCWHMHACMGVLGRRQHILTLMQSVKKLKINKYTTFITPHQKEKNI